MTRCTRLLCHLIQLRYTVLMLFVDAVRFLLLCLRPSPALAAENLLLRKQLALYQERDVTPRHASNATRFTLAWLAHWFDRRPTTKCATGLSDDAVSTGGHSSPAHSRWDITRNLRRLGDLLSARGDAGRHRCPRARDVNRGGGRNAPLTQGF
jgi:hypothetical protein